VRGQRREPAGRITELLRGPQNPLGESTQHEERAVREVRCRTRPMSSFANPGGIVSDRILIITGNRNTARRNLVIGGFLCSLTAMVPILFVRNLIEAAICLSVAFFFSEFTIGPMWAIPWILLRSIQAQQAAS